MHSWDVFWMLCGIRHVGQGNRRREHPRAAFNAGIPVGEPRNLQILHHHNDGSYEAIWPHISGGTASFTLTSFSTFAFANKIEASDLPEDCPFSAGACSRPYCTGWPEIRGCQGPVRGREGGTYYLEPRGEATRAECAAMLMRFSERYK